MAFSKLSSLNGRMSPASLRSTADPAPASDYGASSRAAVRPPAPMYQPTTHLAQAANFSKQIGALDNPQTSLRRIRMNRLQLDPNDALGELLRLNERHPDRIFRSRESKVVTGILPGATVTVDNGIATVTNGKVITMNDDNYDAFSFDVNEGDSIKIDTRTGLVIRPLGR